MANKSYLKENALADAMNAHIECTHVSPKVINDVRVACIDCIALYVNNSCVDFGRRVAEALLKGRQSERGWAVETWGFDDEEDTDHAIAQESIKAADDDDQ